MRFLFCLALVGCMVSAAAQNDLKTVSCREMDMRFSLPQSFREIGIDSLARLEKRGARAIKEEFGERESLGWQQACFQLNDSLKRAIMVTSITRKEALSHHDSVEEFAKSVFDESNRFVFERFETKAGIRFDEDKAVSRSEIQLAGKKAYKNKLLCVYGDRLLLTSVSYLFEEGERIFLLNFQSGAKAADNQLVEDLLEKATVIKNR